MSKLTRMEEYRIMVIIRQLRELQGGGHIEHRAIETLIRWLKELGD